MARASLSIAGIEGLASLGLAAPEVENGSGVGAAAEPGRVSTAFGPGTIGRRSLIVWGAATLWLFLAWRAVEGA